MVKIVNNSHIHQSDVITHPYPNSNDNLAKPLLNSVCKWVNPKPEGGGAEGLFVCI